MQEDSGSLKRWGEITGFQNEIVNIINSRIFDHHAKTLNDIHSGSYKRSMIFILIEFFGEIIPNLLNKHFFLDIVTSNLIIDMESLLRGNTEEIGKIEISRANNCSENSSDYSEQKNLKIIFAKKKDHDSNDQKDINCFSICERVHENNEVIFKHQSGKFEEKDLGGLIEVTYSFSKAKEYIIESHKKLIKDTLKHILSIIEYECWTIAGANHKIRNELFRNNIQSVFEREEVGRKFFKDLLSQVKTQYKEFNTDHNVKLDFQIMLYLPSTPNSSEDKGCFIYPYFDDETISFQQKHNLSTPIKELEYIHKLRETLAKELNTQIALDDKFKCFYLSIFNSQLCKRLELTEEISTDNYNNWWLKKPVDPENDSNPDNIKQALVDFYNKFNESIDKTNNYKNLREKIDKSISVSPVNIGKIFKEGVLSNLYEFEDYKSDYVKLWKNAFDNHKIDVYQPVPEGIVGYYAFNFLPFCWNNQEITGLELKTRKSLSYVRMGLIEGGVNIGGGKAPAAVLPLTSKGQLVGALVAIKNIEKENSPNVFFKSNELRTLEYIANWLADIIQEAKDLFVYRHMSQPPLSIEDLKESTNREIVLKSFMKAIGIVSNITDVKVQENENPKAPHGLPELQKGNHPPNFWTFFLPKNIWGVKNDVEIPEYEITLKFSEPDDVIENFQIEIEKLYRNILQILGLRQVNLGKELSESSFLPEILNFTKCPDIQYDQFNKLRRYCESPPQISKNFFEGPFNNLELTDRSTYYNCNTCKNNFNNKFYEFARKQNFFSGDERRKLSMCSRCWWNYVSKRETTDEQHHLKARFRALIYCISLNIKSEEKIWDNVKLFLND